MITLNTVNDKIVNKSFSNLEDLEEFLLSEFNFPEEENEEELEQEEEQEEE